MFKEPLNVNEQVAINGQASRARAERDQKHFVRQIFTELELLKTKNDNLQTSVDELTKLVETLVKKADKKAKTEE